MKASLNLEDLQLFDATAVDASNKKKAEAAVPGKPSFHLE